MASHASPVPSTRRNSPRCANCNSQRLEVKCRQEVHLLVAVVLTITALLIITYFITFVYLPNRFFVNTKSEVCVILAANLACWRPSLISFSQLEQGRFTCWHFVVNHINGTALVQHNVINDFPIGRNGCNTEETCGVEEWPCRISNNPSIVALRWTFPVSAAIYCAIAVIFVTVFAIMATRRFLRCGDNPRLFGSTSSGTTEHGSLGSSIPFSFRRRMPSWMKHQPSVKTEYSAASPLRTVSSPAV